MMLFNIIHFFKKSLLNQLILRMSSLVIAVILVFPFIFLFTLNFSSKLDKMDFIYERMENQIQNEKFLGRDFLYNEKNNSLFYSTNHSEIFEKLKDSHLQFDVAYQEMKSLVLPEFIQIIEKINKTENIYFKQHSDLVLITKELGYKDWGLEGKWREKIHQLEDIFQNNSNSSSNNNNKRALELIQYLQLRRDEKDYLLRNDNAYVLKIKSDIENLKDLMKHNTGYSEKDFLLITEYSQIFDQYLDKQKNKTEIETQLKYTEGVMLSEQLDFKDQLQNKIDDYKIIIRISIIIFIIVLMTTLSYLVYKNSKSIYDPIEKIKDHLSQISKGDYSKDLDLKRNDEFLNLQNEFNSMLNYLRLSRNQFKKATIGEISANIAHDINNPLMIIKMTVNILEKQIEKNNQNSLPNEITGYEKLFKRIYLSVDRINKITKSIKNLARESNEKEYSKVNLIEIIEESIFFIEIKLKQFEVSFQLNAPQHEIFINAHSTQISQVLVNLISNAVDAIEKLDDKWVHLEVIAKEKEVDIVLTDSGPGIPLEIRNKLFKLSMTTKESGKGTGLGLMITKQIIDQHSGLIFIEDYKNTRFVIRLPIYGATSSVEKAA